MVFPLNYIDYNREDAKQMLMKECSYRDYGLKHHESVLTRFYQCYILPQRWGIDKRKAHLSCLICAGQLGRREALEELKRPPYHPEVLKSDKQLILNMLGIEEAELQNLMTLPKRSHEEFRSDRRDPVMGLVRKLAASKPGKLLYRFTSAGSKRGGR